MRIITGKARGAKLKAPKGENTRPTADRIKESLFNMLGYGVLDTTVLDLFSGTGNLALEALSRGAKHAVLVDHNRESITCIKDNLSHTKLQEQAQVYQGDVFSIIARLNQQGQGFDIIFADPPYGQGLEIKLLSSLNNTNLVNFNGIIIIEHSKADSLPTELGKFNLVKRKDYGATTSISFYKLNQEEK